MRPMEALHERKGRQPLLEMRRITKSFGGVFANEDVSLRCYPGEVISLLGENGAGKTTLMKVLYGMHAADSGEIVWKGEPVSIRTPGDAIRLGIQMVHQHFMLIPTLSVAENLVLGREPKKHGIFQRCGAEEICEELSRTYGLRIDGRRRVSTLSVGERQRVEILKALYRGAELLILDEPTAVLTPQETRELFGTIGRLRAMGKSIIIITHKLKETREISDRVYVLRGGKITGERQTAGATIDELTELMVGYRLVQTQNQHPTPGDALLCVKNLSLREKQGRSLLRELNFTVYSGEILGVAGVEGNGQEELIEVLSGIRSGWDGEMELRGVRVEKPTPARLMELGVATIHADRQYRGLLLDKSAVKNMMLGFQRDRRFYRRPRLVWKLAERQTAEEMERFDIRPRDPQRAAGEFSGGNQQKLIVARELGRDAQLLIAANPTRGIDIGAVNSIHQKLLQARDGGRGVLLISSDLDEIMELSDRIAVIYEGRIVTLRAAVDFTELELGTYMGGTADA